MDKKPLFHLGRVVATPGALHVMIEAGLGPYALLAKHVQLEPGLLGKEDQQTNREALSTGARILSAYDVGGQKLWLITEAADDDGFRAATTILRPDEY